MMGIHHQHHDDHHRLFSSFNSGSNEEMKQKTNLYHDAAIATTITSPAAGGKMAADFGFPFTSAQWKELERQAMIYKYIRDSVPVPPHLLLPIGKNLSKGEMGSIFNLNFKISNAAEPGRCKRTDGKKWRCSRDVAPNQKYCERHLHRGRPRSRKSVEIHSNDSKRTRVDHHVPPHSNANTNISPIETTFFGFQSDVSVPSYKEYNRGLNWAMEEQWQHLLQKNGGLMMTEESSISHTNASVFQHDSIGELVNLVPFADFGDYRNEGFNFFVNSDVMCLENQSLMEKGLSDAWSSEDPNSNESSILSQGNLSPPLSLSMAMSAGAGSELNDEIGQISSLISPVWMDSCTPGGPLAEVLGGGGIAEGLDLASSFACNGASAL